MIRGFRHGALRLWLLVLWGIPAGFWLLPRIMAWLPDLPAAPVMALFLVAGGCFQGGILDLIGRQRVRSLIREGELWEQAGIRPRAEERYLRAVRAFDSILVSPWFSRGLALDLARVMAGFYLSGKTRYPGFRQAAARYLIHRPGDEALAQLWLERGLDHNFKGSRDRLFSVVLTALAQVHQDNPKLAFSLAVCFLDQDRSDFPARRLYRSVLRLLEGDLPEADRFPQAYEEKLKTFLSPQGGLKGMDDSDTGTQEIRVTLGNEMGSPEIVAPDFPENARRPRGKYLLGLGGRMANTLVSVLARNITGAGAGLRQVAVLKKEKIRRYLKATLICVLTACLGIFLWSSLAHMLKSTSMEPVMHPVGEAASGPFTIQVAAYLKQSHADRYLKTLTDKGLKAYIKKIRGGGKTWYLVRVSHFRTKQEASTFGRKLKSQGKIEDFFVSNS